MKVLVVCEYSGRVREAFRKRGHDAWSCDLLESEDGSPHHIQGDVAPVLSQGWDLLIGHPPCTYLNRAGWHWVNKPDQSTLPLKGEPRRRAAKEAAAFFLSLWNAPIERVAIENPRPISHVNLPKWTQVVQPWMFGHMECKATCLWLRGLPKLEETNDVYARMMKLPKRERQRLHYLPPGEERWKERSRTFSGIAEAMAEQWGHAAVPVEQPSLL